MGILNLVEKQGSCTIFAILGSPSIQIKTGGKHTNLLRRIPCIPLRLKVYGWMKRSLTFVRVLGRPRNKNKYCLATGPDLGVCTSTLKSFGLFAHFLHYSLRFNIPGQKNIYYHWAKCAKVKFSG